MKNLLDTLTDKFKEVQERKKNYEENQKAREMSFRDGNGNGEVVKVELSAKTIIKVLLIVAAFWAAQQIFFQIQTILIIAAISFFLAIGLAPIVSAIERWKVPRPLAILLLYVLFLGGLGVLFVKIIPILAEQLLDIAYDLRSFILNNEIKVPFLQGMLERFGAELNPEAMQAWISENLAVISQNLQSAAGSAFGVMSQVFKGVFNLIFAMVLLFFILMEREQIANFALALFPKKDREYILEKSEVIQTKMSQWLRGQVILMFSVGTFMYVGMKILELTLGMKYAATIGLLAAFMEVFPYIGVIITGLLAGLIALNISWVVLVAVLIWIAITQFLEGNVLVPIVMEKVVGLSSVATLLALAVGGLLGNAIGGVPLSILGMILAVPVAASISIFVEEYVNRKG